MKSKLQRFAPGVNITFEKLAVTEQQIKDLKLPTRPEKNGKGKCTEVDAIPPTILRQIIENAITNHIDPHQLEQTQNQEKLEIESGRYLIDLLVTER